MLTLIRDELMCVKQNSNASYSNINVPQIFFHHCKWATRLLEFCDLANDTDSQAFESSTRLSGSYFLLV